MASNSIKLAWRNLGRNRRRTVITGTALSVGMSLCVATYGIMDGMNADILRSLTQLDLGHVQVHHPEFPRKKSLDKTIPNAEQLKKRIEKIFGIAGSSSRVYGYGLVSHKAKSAGVQLVGVDPKAERGVTQMYKHIFRGRYLDNKPTPWPKGRPLSKEEKAKDDQLTREAEEAALSEIDQLAGLEDDPQASKTKNNPAKEKIKYPTGSKQITSGEWTRRLAKQIAPPPRSPPPVLIGAKLAKILEAKVGQTIYLITQSVDGLAAENDFYVSGIFKTGTDVYDRTRIYLHIQDLQRFLRLGQRIHEITIRVKSPREAGLIAKTLASQTKNDGLLVQSWDVIRPDIKNMLELNSVSTGLMVLVIFSVAALGVINTMLMSVFERTRELGMLKAIGMSSAAILWLVILETLFLVLVSSIIGTAIGVGLDLYMIVYGIDLSSFSDGISIGGMGISPVIHGAITVEGLVVPIVTLSTMCFLAAFYPAIRAARMSPAQGMREV